MSKTQLKIYRSTVSLVSEKGLIGAATAKIADEAGIANGTLFHHFKTKKILISATYLWIQEEYMWHMMGLFDHTQSDLEKRWKKALRLSVDYWVRNPANFEFVRQTYNSNFFDKKLKNEVSKIQNRLTDALESGVKHKVIRPMPTNILINLIFSTLFQIAYLMLNDMDGNEKKIRKEGLNFLWRGIKYQ